MKRALTDGADMRSTRVSDANSNMDYRIGVPQPQKRIGPGMLEALETERTGSGVS